jgi:hypothetical protein
LTGIWAAKAEAGAATAMANAVAPPVMMFDRNELRMTVSNPQSYPYLPDS